MIGFKKEEMLFNISLTPHSKIGKGSGEPIFEGGVRLRQTSYNFAIINTLCMPLA